MANKLGADFWFSTQYIQKDNKYTGEVISMWDSTSKKEIINQLSIDYSKSYAYGDTTRVTMLESIAYPTAINPNKKLLDLIERKGLDCTIVVERKDMVYMIKGESQFNFC